MRLALGAFWRGALFVAVALAAIGCAAQRGHEDPTAPTPTPAPAPAPPAPSTAVRLTAIGASDVIGVGSTQVCVPFTDCPNGNGYVFVAARQLRNQGFDVTVRNLGIATAVISRRFQTLGQQHGRTILGNFLDHELPLVPADTTLATIFAGANDVNVITAALGAGAGGTDPVAYIDQQVRAFGEDYSVLVNGVRNTARSSRLVLLNVPNLGALPFLAGTSLQQRQAAQRASVLMSTTVINTWRAQGAVVIDLLCNSRIYQPSMYSSDGFHPNDSGYALMADEVARAATAGASYPAPQASCPDMSRVP